MIQFGLSNFHQEFDHWFYWIVVSILCLHYPLKSTFDGIGGPGRSAPFLRFEIRCMNSTAVAGFEMWLDDASLLL